MVVLITGCRSGFGKDTALTLARNGHHVYAGLRDVHTATELLEDAGGLPITAVQLDVTNDDQRRQVVDDIIKAHGRIDALVNNAGIAINGPVELFSEKELRRMFEVNFFGLWSLTNAVLPQMRAQGFGTVVNVSSMAGRSALPTMGAYAASKHAVSGMSEALRMEVRADGIHVVLIEPGPYKTDLFTRNQMTCAAALLPDSPYQHLMERMAALQNHAGGRGGRPSEVAERIAAVLQHPSPPLRNPMGPHVRLRRLARWMLPAGMYEWIVYRGIYGAKPTK